MNRGVHCARIYIIDRINRVDLNQVCLTGNAPGKRIKRKRKDAAAGYAVTGEGDVGGGCGGIGREGGGATKRQQWNKN